jgi:hypothetical protein
MRAHWAAVVVALWLGGCAPPSLTPRQLEYLRTHPALGTEVRDEVLGRVLFAGESVERVLITLDGLSWRRADRDDHTQVELLEFVLPVDSRAVTFRSGGAILELAPGGRLVITFRNGMLFSCARIE